ncbi:MAG: LD-carboxypeptidase [Firmicutes bacterium]|nr:LD-carboxypeptidase [Bacillota bacterium]
MFLNKGDTIGFFSPSKPITYLCPIRTKRAQDFLVNAGFKLKGGKLSGKRDFYRSGTLQERVDEINSLIHDPSISCIMSTIGGMNSNSLVPYIDYEYLKKNPKIIIGYSDMTAILLSIYEKCSIPVFYGPALVATFGEFPPYNNASLMYMLAMLSEKRKFPMHLEKPSFWTDEYLDWELQDRTKKAVENKWVTVQPGTATGRLIIGNLDTMYGIWGSPYMPCIKEGDILFIEESLKDISEAERGFAFLECNGIFDRISGLILGKYEAFDDKDSKRMPHDVLSEIIRNKKIPVLSQVDCSHTHPMFTLPIGANITMDATNQRITINSLVSE